MERGNRVDSEKEALVPLRIVGCCILVLALVVALGSPAEATWSIILVDARTREIGIASATCVAAIDLRQLSPVVLVGVGAAAAQATVPFTAHLRQYIRDQMNLGTDPGQILLLLAKQDTGHQMRQYGIVDVNGRAVGFTGQWTLSWTGHLTGRIGSLYYAIQGNILTGSAVIEKAEQAVRSTPGDLAAKLMAAMQAARAMGGDGRCSCPSYPTGCGSPPQQFQKAAHVGYMIVAREGDQDGGCNTAQGCATGTYYLNHNVVVQSTSAPDPVLQLQSLYTAWRSAWVNRPDHMLSTVTFSPTTLPADGRSATTAVLALRDWQGAPIQAGGAKVTVTLDPASPAPVTVGKVIDLQNGTYTFPVTAGTTPGTAVLRVTVDDGKGSVLLSPRSMLPVLPVSLKASHASVSAASGATVVFDLTPGSRFASRPYLLLASASGSSPGIPVGPGIRIPLNPDPVFHLTSSLANSPLLPGSAGAIDAAGQARARLVAPPGLLTALRGATLTFAFGLLDPLDYASQAVAIRVLP